MPLVQHNQLPSIDRVCAEGTVVSSLDQINPNFPEIHVGFLNMMPDQAIAATERQFLRLMGAHDQINCWFHPFTISGITRSDQALAHVNQYYTDFAAIQSMKLDALIITGANVTQPLLVNESFWVELEKILLWAKQDIQSTVCSCLATHAAAKVFYGVDREHLSQKCWGVFEHEVVAPNHVLMSDVELNLAMCHSRFNDVSAQALAAHGAEILINSPHAGVQCAIDEKLGMLYFQGHPEYDDISLLKEYKREIARYLFQQREDYPPVPIGYFSEHALQTAEQFKQLVIDAQKQEDLLANFPEEELQAQLQNQWRQASLHIFRNWLHSLAY